MNIEELIREYLRNVNILQLATSANNQPWICTVHFYADEDLNLYWSSTLERRHSKELAQNPKAAVYFLIHENTPNENYVIGLAASGMVELLGGNIDEQIGQAYINKLDKDPNLVKDVRAGKSPHQFYKMTIDKFVLFDTKNFPDQPRQQWKLGT